MNKFNPSSAWSLDNRMTVVLFAGMGGGCDGLERAGYPVHLAVNHDPIAVALHEKRHPHTKHLRCDVFEVDPCEATKGRGVRILHASPDCTHFSVAKGGKPVSKRRRSLAWVVPRWAGQVRPETITLENVPEIRTWGPLIAKRDPETGRVMRLDKTVAAKGERVPVHEQWLIPDPDHKGRIWRAWLKHMAGLGYRFEGKVLVCADYGVPTIRKRFFGVATLCGLPIVWPERTHAPIAKAKALGLKPWVGADTCVDFSLPVKSIFGRKKDLADASKRRTAHGVMRHVVNAEKAFIVPITHAGGIRVHSTKEPFRTLTTAHRGELALAAVHLEKYNQNGVGILPSEPLGTVMAGGQGHALVAAFLAQHNTNAPSRSGRAPVSTLVGTGSTQGVVAASLGRMRGADRHGQPITSPMPTQTSGGGHEYLILGFLQHYYGTGGQDQALDRALGALTAKARHGLVTVKVGKALMVIMDIGTRMLEPEEGAAAHGFEAGCLDHTIDVWSEPKGRMISRKLTKTEKYHLVGNSVPPLMIELLARANVQPEFEVAV